MRRPEKGEESGFLWENRRETRGRRRKGILL